MGPSLVSLLGVSFTIDMNYVPSKFMGWSPKHQYDSIWGLRLWELLRIRWSLDSRVCALKRRCTRELACAFSVLLSLLCPQRGHVRWQPLTSQEKRLQNETHLVDTLILDFSVSIAVRSNVCCLRPPVCSILFWQSEQTKTLSIYALCFPVWPFRLWPHYWVCISAYSTSYLPIVLCLLCVMVWIVLFLCSVSGQVNRTMLFFWMVWHLPS